MAKATSAPKSKANSQGEDESTDRSMPLRKNINLSKKSESEILLPDRKSVMEKKPVPKLPHHEQQELCHTRAPYRQGRKLTAVKVYTINDESTHLIVSGVPTPNYSTELKKKFIPFGDIKEFHVIAGYDCEEFTEAVHVHYARIQSARIAKKILDGFNFFGGVLHIFYAPELETLTETRLKLAQRKRDVSVRIKRHKEDPTNPEIDPFRPELELDHKTPVKRKKKRVADFVQGK